MNRLTEAERRICHGIRKLKTLKGLRLQDFKEVDLYPGQVSDWIQGRKIPTVKQMDRFASAFDMDFEQFINFCKRTDGMDTYQIAMEGILNDGPKQEVSNG